MNSILESGDVIRCYPNPAGFHFKMFHFTPEGGTRRKCFDRPSPANVDPVVDVRIPFQYARTVCELMAKGCGLRLGEDFSKVEEGVSFQIF